MCGSWPGAPFSRNVAWNRLSMLCGSHTWSPVTQHRKFTRSSAYRHRIVAGYGTSTFIQARFFPTGTNLPDGTLASCNRNYSRAHAEKAQNIRHIAGILRPRSRGAFDEGCTRSMGRKQQPVSPRIRERDPGQPSHCGNHGEARGYFATARRNGRGFSRAFPPPVNQLSRHPFGRRQSAGRKKEDPRKGARDR